MIPRTFRAFRPLPTEGKIAVLAVFCWLVITTALGTVSLIRQEQEARRHAQEQRVTARTARLACERSRAFGPPLVALLADIEARLKTGVLKKEIMFHGKRETVLQFYRESIPARCP